MSDEQKEHELWAWLQERRLIRAGILPGTFYESDLQIAIDNGQPKLFDISDEEKKNAGKVALICKQFNKRRDPDDIKDQDFYQHLCAVRAGEIDEIWYDSYDFLMQYYECSGLFGIDPLEDESDSPAKSIQVLIAILLEPARAGGLTKKQADRIFDQISSSYNNLDPEAMDRLLEDILMKWVPAAQETLSVEDDGEDGDHEIKQVLIDLAESGAPKPQLGDNRRHESGYTYHELAVALEKFTTPPPEWN